MVQDALAKAPVPIRAGQTTKQDGGAPLFKLPFGICVSRQIAVLFGTSDGRRIGTQLQIVGPHSTTATGSNKQHAAQQRVDGPPSLHNGLPGEYTRAVARGGG